MGRHGSGSATRALRLTGWAPVFACFLAVFLCWSLATPLFGSPDENFHAAVSAELIGGDDAVLSDGDPFIPEDAPCFAFLQGTTPACAEGVSVEPYDWEAEGYPPLLHAVLGTVSLGTDGRPMVYAMRGLNAVICAALLTLGVQCLRRTSAYWLLRTGVLVALTPMVFFMGGTVTSSGMAITSGFAAWASGLELVDATRTGRHPGRVRTWLLLLGSLLVLLLVRRDSALWTGLIAVALLALLGAEEIRRGARSWRVVSVASAVVAAMIVQVLVWGGSFGSGFAASGTGGSGGSGGAAGGGARDVPLLGQEGRLLRGFGQTQDYLEQLIGRFGWLDTPLPDPMHTVWFLLLGALVVPALGLASRRTSLVLAGSVAVTVLAGAAIGVIRHPYFQGRYVLPFAVGVPLIACWGLAARFAGRSPPGRVHAVVASMISVVHVVALYQVLRRFTVGLDGSLDFAGSEWLPPLLPVHVLLLVQVVAVAALAFVLHASPSDHAGTNSDMSMPTVPVGAS